MRRIGWLIGVAMFATVTGGAYLFSGCGVPCRLGRPVSIRDESVGSGRRNCAYLYFGSRRHFGGGFHGGK